MKNLSKNFYITSPIYYVNDSPHIGHAYTSIACDILARLKRLQGFDTRFLTGTDEHGQKVQRSAEKLNKTPQEFCDLISKNFFALTELLNLTNDDFIRTTEARHQKSVVKFWKKLEERGFIYLSVYEGWYAVRDEAFYAQDELIDGKAPTGADVEWHKEESYFFKLSAFQDQLLKFYEQNPDFIEPESRRNEVISFVRGGKEYQQGALQDLSISRTSFNWGIKVPDENAKTKHVIYVWLDALVNYLSALDYADDAALYQKFWADENAFPIHIVGKDILRFHAVYWPAFLMAADLPLPKKIFAHGWWTNQGQKISKSLGNVIDPKTEINWIAESFTWPPSGAPQGFNAAKTVVDYFRYFLFREVAFGSDGNYSRPNLVQRINAELVNNIGNLCQRTLSMIFKNGEIVDVSGYQAGSELLKKCEELIADALIKINDLQFEAGIQNIISCASSCNLFLEQNAPWNLKKLGKVTEMNLVLTTVANALKMIALVLQPVVPHLSLSMLDLLQLKEVRADQLFTRLSAGHKIAEPKVIFPKLA